MHSAVISMLVFNSKPAVSLTSDPNSVAVFGVRGQVQCSGGYV